MNEDYTNEQYTGMDGAHYNNENGLAFSPILASTGVDGNPEHHIEVTTPDRQVFALRLQKNILDEYEFHLYHGTHIGNDLPAAEAHERPHALKTYDLSEIVSGPKKYENLIRDMKNSFLSMMNDIYLLLPVHDGCICCVQMKPQDICKFSQQEYLGRGILGSVVDTFSADHYPSMLYPNSKPFHAVQNEDDKRLATDILERLNKEQCVMLPCEMFSAEQQALLDSSGINLKKDDTKFEWLLAPGKDEVPVPSCFLSMKAKVKTPSLQMDQDAQNSFLQKDCDVQLHYKLPDALKILKGFIKTSNEGEISSIESPKSNFAKDIPPTLPQWNREESSQSQSHSSEMMKRRRTDMR